MKAFIKTSQASRLHQSTNYGWDRLGCLLGIVFFFSLVDRLHAAPAPRTTNDPREALTREMQQLNGAWKLVDYENDNAKKQTHEQRMASIAHIRWVFENGKLSIKWTGKENKSGIVTFTIDPFHYEKKIDFYGVENGVAHLVPGIYQIDGDVLTISKPTIKTDRNWYQRPKSFSDPDTLLMRFERVRE